VESGRNSNNNKKKREKQYAMHINVCIDIDSRFNDESNVQEKGKLKKRRENICIIQE